MSYYREGELRPTNCEQCDCRQARWNGRSDMLRVDPPTTCTCEHLFSRHVFRSADLPAEATADA